MYRYLDGFMPRIGAGFEVRWFRKKKLFFETKAKLLMIVSGGTSEQSNNSQVSHLVPLIK